MKRLVSRLTWFAKTLILATVVVGVIAALTRWLAAIIAFAVILLLWLGAYSASDPATRLRTGDDPALDAEKRWTLD